MANSNTPPTFIEMVRDTIVTYKGTVGKPLSIADVSKIARVEPITLISSNLTGVKELYTVLHGLLNIYAAFYLQAISILSAQLSDVRILKILDKTNPDRDLRTLLASGYSAYESYNTAGLSNNVKTLTLENCKYRLPMLDSKSTISTEALFEYSENDVNLDSSINKIETFEKLGSAVGKVIEVKFAVRGNRDSYQIDTSNKNSEISIPVVVKLDNMIIPSDVLNQITVSNATEITLGARFKDALAGRISFIKDFIFASDLIKAQKKTMIKDPTGYYTQLLKRINNSRLYSAISGNISLAGVSSIIVLSEEDENVIQRKIGGKLTNESTRNIVFDNTSAMMLVIVDKEWERVTIYVRDIDSFSQNSFDAFKSMADKNNNNILDIVKAFSLNSAPSF